MNKTILVSKNYNKKRIDYDKTFDPTARLEAIRMLLAFAPYINFRLYQINVKSAILKGYIEEEVNV